MKLHPWLAGLLATACGGTAPRSGSVSPSESYGSGIGLYVVEPTGGADAAPEREPEDIAVEGLLGKLDAASIEATVRRGFRAVAACHHDATEELPFVGGRIRFQGFTATVAAPMMIDLAMLWVAGMVVAVPALLWWAHDIARIPVRPGTGPATIAPAGNGACSSAGSRAAGRPSSL